jgi:hypothetical protein
MAMSMPKGSVAHDDHDEQVTPDVRAPPFSWSFLFGRMLSLLISNEKGPGLRPGLVV